MAGAEDEQKPGQNVGFSGGELAKDLESMPRFEYKDDDATKAEVESKLPEFSAGQQVMVRRSAGHMESSWYVESLAQDGLVTVVSNEGGHTLEKQIRPEKLAALQPKFEPEQPVVVYNPGGQKSDRDYHVLNQDSSGMVLLVAGDMEKMFRKRIPAAQLFEWQHKIPDKLETPVEPAKSKRGLGRFFNR